MKKKIPDKELNEYLDSFIAVTTRVIPTAADLEGYLPTLALFRNQERHLIVLESESGEGLQSHDELLHLLAYSGESYASEKNSWPQAVICSYASEGGISLYGCSEDGRTAAANLNYAANGAINTEVLYFNSKDKSLAGYARNPAAHFYKSAPNRPF